MHNPPLWLHNNKYCSETFFPQRFDFLVHLHLHSRLRRIQWAIVKLSCNKYINFKCPQSLTYNCKTNLGKFQNLLIYLPTAKCWTNYLRRGSVISSYGPCGHFGCGSLFKTYVKLEKNSHLFKWHFCIELPIVSPIQLNCLLSCLCNWIA